MKLIRFTVNMNEETRVALEASAQRNDVSLTETIRRAISILAFIEHEIDTDHRIITERKDGGHRREIILF